MTPKLILNGKDSPKINFLCRDNLGPFDAVEFQSLTIQVWNYKELSWKAESYLSDLIFLTADSKNNFSEHCVAFAWEILVRIKTV